MFTFLDIATNPGAEKKPTPVCDSTLSATLCKFKSFFNVSKLCEFARV